MEEMYWITRMDNFRAFLIFLVVLFTLGAIACIITWLNCDEDREDDRKIRSFARKMGPRSLFIGILSTIILVFIPTTNEALVIYGIGGTIEFVKSDAAAQALPHKVIKACDLYLDKLNEQLQDDKDE